jgi:hypothetical protein
MAPPQLQIDATSAHMVVEMKKNLTGIHSWGIVVWSSISIALINLVISLEVGDHFGG